VSEAAVRAVFVNPAIQPGQAHAEAKRFLARCEAMFAAGVERIAATAQEEEDDRSLRQNAFLWSFVYKTISAQGLIDGIGSDEEGWHYYFKKRVLGYRVRKVRVPGSKRPVIRRELRSTTELKARRRGEADPTTYMPDYLDAVMAIAASEFGVQFPADQRWETWRQ
jgi:hypothetical protein